MTASRANKELDIGVELWAVADALRGSMDAGEYKNVVLGLVFLKHLSDHGQLGAGERGAASSGEVWKRLEASTSAKIGEAIDEAMRAVEEANPSLIGVLPTNYGRDELDKTRLKQVVDLIGGLSFDQEVGASDVLGRVYEYFLLQFDRSYGRAAGEFYTPRDVVELLVDIIEPTDGVLYDPCCGSGGMFVQSMGFSSKSNLQVYGQEYNPTTWRLAQMNLSLRGIAADLGDRWADTFSDDVHPNLRADYILANPPYNGAMAHVDGFDPRWEYGLPPKANTNYAWLQHILYHLAPGGVAAVLMANGSLTSDQAAERAIREQLVKGGVVDAVVALPDKLFYTTGISVCVWVLSKGRGGTSKGRSRRDEVLFIDARRLGHRVTRAHRELGRADISRIADTYNAWSGKDRGAYKNQLGFCKAVEVEEILTNSSYLAPGRYVDLEPSDGMAVDHAEGIQELVTRVGLLRSEGEAVSQEIISAMRNLGYEV